MWQRSSFRFCWFLGFCVGLCALTRRPLNADLMDISGLLNNKILSFSLCSPGFAGFAPVFASSGFSASVLPSSRHAFSPAALCAAIFCRLTNAVAELVFRVAASARCLQRHFKKIVVHIGDIRDFGDFSDLAAQEFNQTHRRCVSWVVRSFWSDRFCSAR